MMPHTLYYTMFPTSECPPPMYQSFTMIMTQQHNAKLLKTDYTRVWTLGTIWWQQLQRMRKHVPVITNNMENMWPHGQTQKKQTSAREFEKRCVQKCHIDIICGIWPFHPSRRDLICSSVGKIHLKNVYLRIEDSSWFFSVHTAAPSRF